MPRRLLNVDWATLPWKLDEYGLFIMDAGNRKVLDIRGWGHLTGGGALHLPQKDAEEAQKELGHFLVNLVNNPIPDKNSAKKETILQALRLLQKAAIDVKDDGTGGAIRSINLEAIADQVLK